MIRTVVCLATVALLTTRCSDASKLKFATTLQSASDKALALAEKAKPLIPTACKVLDATKYDEMLIGAVSMAIADLTGTTIAGAVVDKVLSDSVAKFCEWNGVILNPTQQAE